MFRVFRRFIALPYRRKMLAGEALFYLYFVKLLLLIFPVKTVVAPAIKRRGRWLDTQKVSLPAVRQALDDADRISFWKNRCLVKSIAGRWMLQRRGLDSRISFGVKHDAGGKLTAHAWLKSGDFEVVGKDGNYTELAEY